MFMLSRVRSDYVWDMVIRFTALFYIQRVTTLHNFLLHTYTSAHSHVWTAVARYWLQISNIRSSPSSGFTNCLRASARATPTASVLYTRHKSLQHTLLWIRTQNWLNDIKQSKPKSCYDWRSVSQYVLVSSSLWNLWPDIIFCLKVAVLSLWSALSDERSGLSPVSHCQQYLVHCQKFNMIYIVYVTCFMYMQYILYLCQHRLSTADHAKTSVATLQQESRHLEGRTLDRRQV
jgi:hypothetical protein